MEPALGAVVGGLGVIVMGLLGMVFRNGKPNGALGPIDERTEKMVELLAVIAERTRREP